MSITEPHSRETTTESRDILLAEVADLRDQVKQLTHSGCELIGTQARLHSLLHQVNDAIIQFEPDGTISNFNSAAQVIFDYHETAVMHGTGSDLFEIPKRFDGNLPAYLSDYSRNTENQYENPLIGIRSDGERIMLKVSIASIAASDMMLFDAEPDGDSSAESGFDGFLCILHDITQRKHIDDELRQHRERLEQLVEEQVGEIRLAKEEAERANKAKSEFLAKVSHELRTPMHAILSYSDFGLKKFTSAPPEKLEQYFSRINTAGSRLLGMIDDLLDFSKSEAGYETYDMQAGDLHALVESVTREYEVLAECQALQLRLRLELPDPLIVMDTPHMEKVVRNLLSNALHFSPHGGLVELITDEAQLSESVAAVRLRVRDHGKGIPENELDTVFEKFVQGRQNRNSSKGTGLGLAISREVVVAHGGKISATNADGGGACFEVILPREVH